MHNAPKKKNNQTKPTPKKTTGALLLFQLSQSRLFYGVRKKAMAGIALCESRNVVTKHYYKFVSS